MKDFMYSYPTKMYFGDGAAEKALQAELAGIGKTIMLALGGGSVIDYCKIIAAQAVIEKDIWKMEFEDHVYPTEYLPMGAVIINEETNQKAGYFRGL